MPVQIGIMYNNMDCRKVISSPKDQAYISYNMNQSDFKMYNRKFQHCFKAEITNFHELQHGNDHDHEDCNSSQGYTQFLSENLSSSKSFCVADEGNVRFYDAQQFT